MVALPHHDIREELTVDDISLVAIAVAMGANVAAALFGAATCYVYENVAPRSEGATAQWRELGIRVGMAMLYSVSLVLVLLSGGSFLLFAIRVGWMSNPMAFFITVVRGPVALLLILYICLA
ncbi:hypothetical protein BOTBODRAFT_49980 [Botryobasidium botryosum FD-172 SS1]|uniref:Uncharacterized protein n=1 Tax=Botryobasidium botryosum (strain FD-172 SS1) TaxID=930990 RepID=A0A067N042_BOTB1|nr:hypothetical protein BOTBODRAFT_49980 [Botryobasidium botryosum FD-172 SS1]